MPTKKIRSEEAPGSCR